MQTIDLVKTRMNIPRQDNKIFSQVDFNIEHGPWIAGGAPLRWHHGVNVGRADMDIFVANKAQFDRLYNILSPIYDQFYESANAVSFRGTGIRIQLIKKFFASAEELLGHFDIRVCQFLTDGKTCLATKEAIEDDKSKQINFTRFNPENAIKRTLKYMSYGYSLSPESISKIESGDTKFLFSDVYNGGDCDYENAF
jgi:hypothetical protein